MMIEKGDYIMIDDKYAVDYDIDFNWENTFISDCKDNLMKIAPSKLALLNAENHTIVVTDRYLFPNFKAKKHENKYEKDLLTLLEGCGVKKIIYCSDKIDNLGLYRRVVNTLSQKSIAVTHNKKIEKFHDRFWYCPETEKCICFGTSLNGIGKAICLISELEESDVITLKNYFNKAGIL